MALVIDLDECRHVDFVKLVGVRVGDFTLATTKASLSVAARDALAFIQTDVDRAAELDVGRVGELERAEFRHQEVAVFGVEVLEQIRINRATANIVISRHKSQLRSTPLTR